MTLLWPESELHVSVLHMQRLVVQSQVSLEVGPAVKRRRRKEKTRERK